MEEELIKIKHGRFKGQLFRVEGLIQDIRSGGGTEDLHELAFDGNWAAKNAIEIDKYSIENKPFYYGKIGALGYIISAKDLGK